MGLGSDLWVRAGSGIVLAIVALGAAYLGGWVFALFWLAAAIVVAAEWLRIVLRGPANMAAAVSAAALVVATVCALIGQGAAAGAAVLAGAGLASLARPAGSSPVLAALAVPYAAAAVVPIVVLRAGPAAGLASILFLFAIVWGTDVMAYVTGRALGGPKLWPAVSPKKTWSGFLGGILCGSLAGAIVSRTFGVPGFAQHLLVGLGLAVVSQGGDLAESALKRQFDVKDSGRIIPGHGGAMDRLDGFLAAALLAVVVGLARNGADPAAGLLVW